MVAGPDLPADDNPADDDAALLEELGRLLRAADALLLGLADDMAAAGARSASERTERARTELQAAERIVEQLHARREDDAGR